MEIVKDIDDLEWHIQEAEGALKGLRRLLSNKRDELARVQQASKEQAK